MLTEIYLCHVWSCRDMLRVRGIGSMLTEIYLDSGCQKGTWNYYSMRTFA
jgi:hypothetical protein